MDRFPPGYVCGVCGGEQGKLWRVAASSHIRLYCLSCAENATGAVLGTGPCAKDGLYAGGLELVPAIPTEDGKDWYGYTSVPESRVEWWRALPSVAHW